MLDSRAFTRMLRSMSTREVSRDRLTFCELL